MAADSFTEVSDYLPPRCRSAVASTRRYGLSRSVRMRQSVAMASEVERWHIGGRYYGVTAASTPDSFDLELDDLGPDLRRGIVAIASMRDGTDSIGVRLYAEQELPIEVVEQFLAEARRRL